MATKEKTQDKNGTAPEKEQDGPIMDVAQAQKIVNEFDNQRRQRYIAEINAVDQRYGLTIDFEFHYMNGRLQILKTVKELG